MVGLLQQHWVQTKVTTSPITTLNRQKFSSRKGLFTLGSFVSDSVMTQLRWLNVQNQSPRKRKKKKKSDESSARLKTFPPSWQENQHQQHYVTPTHCGPQEPLLLKHHALHLRFSHHSLKSLPKTGTCKTSPRLSGPFTRASLSDLQSQFLQMSCISWPNCFLSHESCLLPSPGVSKAE